MERDEHIKLMNEFFATRSYNRASPWRLESRTNEDPVDDDDELPVGDHTPSVRRAPLTIPPKVRKS